MPKGVGYGKTTLNQPSKNKPKPMGGDATGMKKKKPNPGGMKRRGY